MLAVFAILLLLLASSAILIVHVARSRFGYLWLIALIGSSLAWLLVFFSRSDAPQTVSLLTWQPEALFPITPTLLVDNLSWMFAIFLVTLAVSLCLASVTHLGQSRREVFREVAEPGQAETESAEPATRPIRILSTPETAPVAWQAWAGDLSLTSLGLVAVFAGNLVTMVLAWAAIDLLELVLLLNQVRQSAVRERLILAFSARLGGIVLLMLAGITVWSTGGVLVFSAVPPQAGIYLLLASGLRLGVIPLHLPLHQEIPFRRGLGTALRLVPAAASLALLVRAAAALIPGGITPYLLILTALGALTGAVGWFSASDELDGRPYWIIGMASLAVASAARSQPLSSLAWSLACLFAGGMIFSTSLRHRSMAPISLLSALAFSGLPYTPVWQGTFLYRLPFGEALPPALGIPLAVVYFAAHIILLAGFLRHGLRGFLTAPDEELHIERWVWLILPPSLGILPLVHLWLGWLIRPAQAELSLVNWFAGPLALLLAVLLWYTTLGAYASQLPMPLSRFTPAWVRIFSFDWLYRLLWNMLNTVSRLMAAISTILEGEAGILWALVLLALIFILFRGG